MAVKNDTWKTKYDLQGEKLGRGGNANVFRVKEKATGDEYALKVLKIYKNRNYEREGRFRDEIEIMSKNYRELDGIMPIIDASLDELWYVMPVAMPVINYIKEQRLNFNEILSLCISYANQLEKIHSKTIVHRDIKPLNLYIYNGKCVFGDFGLADFPEKENDFTRTDRGLGAIFTIAPEMRRNPKGADGKKADVFSLAKSMWMLFTLNEKGFDGPYVCDDPTFSLNCDARFTNVHLVEFEKLLNESTNSDPLKRPSMKEVCERLIEYQRILNDFELSQKSEWEDIAHVLFAKHVPKSTVWENPQDIIEVLNVIGKKPVYNHMLFSSHGGLDFHHAELAHESGWIYIYDTLGFCHLVKPKNLFFESFGNDFTWNYFLLELESVAAIENISEWREYEILVEDTPGHFVSAEYEQYGVYDYESGERFPEGYKVVRRFIKGKILIVFKRGLYNSIAATYDGRHGMFTNDEFRKYIEEMIQVEKYAINNQCNVENMLNRCFHQNPFSEENETEIKTIGKTLMSKPEEIEQFIEDNISQWIIELKENNSRPRAYVKYSFEICPNPHSFKSLLEENWMLMKDGHFIKTDNDCESYNIENMKEAIDFAKKLEGFISDKISSAELVRNKYCHYVSVRMSKNEKPTHLFTYEEMINEMRAADDRYDNTIVVDGEGRIRVIRDLKYPRLYPVSNEEAWNAGNVYVGKYAKLDDERDLYMNLLSKWYDYLCSGKNQVVSIYESISQTEEDLVNKIKQEM